MRCIFQSAKLRTNTHTHSQVGIHRHSHTHTDRHTQSGWQAVFINYKLRADYTHYKCYFRATAASPSFAHPSLSLSLFSPLRSTTSCSAVGTCKLFNWLPARWLACACLLDIIYEPIVCLLLLIHVCPTVPLSLHPAVPQFVRLSVVVGSASTAHYTN